MDENDQKLEDVQSEVKPGSGSLLAAERKKQQQSIEDIASELNLSIAQIRAIEADQSEGLPEATYVRGYIRSYANLLKLNPDQILKSYQNADWRKGSSLDDLPRGIGSAKQMKPKGSGFGKVIVVLVLLAGCAFLYFSGIVEEFLRFNQNSTVELANDKTAQVVRSDPAERQLLEIEQEVIESLDPANLDPANIEVPALIAEDSGESTPIKNELTLNFNETSWVDIRDEQDTRLAYQSYPKGEQLTVSSETPMSVFIGNASGVTVQYNGAAFDISSFREGVYAKFIVGE